MNKKLTKTLVESLKASESRYEVNDTEIKGFQLRVTPKGKKTFCYTYRNNMKKRQRVTIGVYGDLTAEQARDKAKEYASLAAQKVDIQEEKKNKTKQELRSAITLDVFLTEKYEAHIVGANKTGNDSAEKIRCAFSHLLDIQLTQVSLEKVDNWRIKSKKGGLHPSTINRYVNALKGALTKATEWNLLDSNPISGLKDYKYDSSPSIRFLSPDEKERLTKTLAERDDHIKQARERANEHRRKRRKALMPSLLEYSYGDRMTPMILLALNTGMRKSELFELEWHFINFDLKFVTVTGKTAKSSKTRHIPLNKTALDALKQWRKQAPKVSNLVFPSDRGGKLNNVYTSWENILEAAEISNFRWHDLRHDFASQLVMKGVPLNTVRDLCGHADISTTLGYAHLAPNHKLEAVEMLD